MFSLQEAKAKIRNIRSFDELEQVVNSLEYSFSCDQITPRVILKLVPDPLEAITALIKSSSDRAVMIDTRHKVLGVGQMTNNGTEFVTLEYAERKIEKYAAMLAANPWPAKSSKMIETLRKLTRAEAFVIGLLPILDLDPRSSNMINHVVFNARYLEFSERFSQERQIKYRNQYAEHALHGRFDCTPLLDQGAEESISRALITNTPLDAFTLSTFLVTDPRIKERVLPLVPKWSVYPEDPRAAQVIIDSGFPQLINPGKFIKKTFSSSQSSCLARIDFTRANADAIDVKGFINSLVSFSCSPSDTQILRDMF